MADARPWLPDGDGHRCTRHKLTFGRLETCPKCEADPGPPPDAEDAHAIPRAPKGCKTSVEHERQFTALAATALTRSNAVLKIAKNTKSQNAAAKWAEIAIRARRAAAELALRREDEAIVRARERRLRERGHGATH